MRGCAFWRDLHRIGYSLNAENVCQKFGAILVNKVLQKWGLSKIVINKSSLFNILKQKSLSDGFGFLLVMKNDPENPKWVIFDLHFKNLKNVWFGSNFVRRHGFSFPTKLVLWQLLHFATVSALLGMGHHLHFNFIVFIFVPCLNYLEGRNASLKLQTEESQPQKIKQVFCF